jgi:6-pyruvoyltetrahydropterin/6-carboxytetrahydropterin synthase
MNAVGKTPGAELEKLRLDETELLYAEAANDDGGWKLTLTRAYEFAASHRLYNEALPEAANWNLYGKCANPGGHGHNYKLEITVSGSPDSKTGMIVSLEELDEAVNRLVVDRYDHHNLNSEIPELQGKVTTSEVVAKAIWDALNGKLPAKLARVRLFETERNVFEIEGN